MGRFSIATVAVILLSCFAANPALSEEPQLEPQPQLESPQEAQQQSSQPQPMPQSRPLRVQPEYQYVYPHQYQPRYQFRRHPAPVTPPPPVPQIKSQPKETFILLPEPEGRRSGIVIRTAGQEVALTEPFQAVELTSGKFVGKTLSAEEIRLQFPDVMQALPEKTRTFILRFEVKGAKLTAESLAMIGSIQQEIARRAAPEIMVIGHTDRVGSDEVNLRLSLSRAEEVRDLLVASGVSPQMIQVVGRGELEPVVVTDDGVAEPLNRRVEVVIR
jgi:outer membrane protein OmpA-like peptidoglycan-associated protein